MNKTDVDYKDQWKKVLALLAGEIPKSKFLTWFKNTAILELADATVVVGVPTAMCFNNIAEQFLNTLNEACKQIIGPHITSVQLKVDGTLYKGDKRVVDVVRLSAAKAKKEKQESSQEEQHESEPMTQQSSRVASQSDPVDTARSVALIEGISSKVLNPRYTLDGFVVGPETQLAYAACCAVGRNPGESYNPLFIYGGVGLGKTHLLQGTGNEVLRRYPKKKVVYVTSEKFTNELIAAIRHSKTDSIRKKYREIDVLIVDDIQFLANKQQTQVEFFHTFNELHQAKKQIIISSDRPPSELTMLEPRLRSRCEWGMTVDVQFPDFETRCAILQMKCQGRGVVLSQDVIEFIAHNVHTSIRELEGVLNQAIAIYELNHVTPTIKTIGPIIQKLHKDRPIHGFAGSDQPRKKATTTEEVIRVVSEFYGVPVDDITGESRKKELVQARQAVMYIAKKDLNYTYEKIGEVMGGRLHSTVMHSCNKLGKNMVKDENLKRDINGIRVELGLL